MSHPVILILGANGQLGHELRSTLASTGSLVCPGREALDLTSPATVRDAIRELRPALIVNAAAYTDVDQAEKEIDRAWQINAHTPGVLAEEAHRCGTWLIHYSTDYVFDGRKETPYAENDSPNPLNEYGRSKLAGEEAIRNRCDTYWIFRTSWLCSDRRSNFLRTMLRLATTRERLTVVDDQIGCPTWAGWLAEATATIISKSSVLKDQASSDTYHLCSRGATSWYGFARAIFDQFGVDKTVAPIPTEEYPTPARRPAYSVLATDAVQEAFDLTIPSWTEQLRRMATAHPSPVSSVVR